MHTFLLEKLKEPNHLEAKDQMGLYYIVTCLLKTGRRPLHGNGSVNTFPRQPNHVTAATDTHTTIGELLKAVFSVLLWIQ
jgi:hypothetical protein